MKNIKIHLSKNALNDKNIFLCEVATFLDDNSESHMFQETEEGQILEIDITDQEDAVYWDIKTVNENMYGTYDIVLSC